MIKREKSTEVRERRRKRKGKEEGKGKGKREEKGREKERGRHTRAHGVDGASGGTSDEGVRRVGDPTAAHLTHQILLRRVPCDRARRWI